MPAFPGYLLRLKSAARRARGPRIDDFREAIPRCSVGFCRTHLAAAMQWVAQVLALVALTLSAVDARPRPIKSEVPDGMLRPSPQRRETDARGGARPVDRLIQSNTSDCIWGGWLEFVWVRFTEPAAAHGPPTYDIRALVRDSPLTLYQVVDSGNSSGSYRSDPGYSNFSCSACCRTRHLPNRGREAPAYLHYMSDRYDSLPQYAIFIHGKPHGGHLLRSRIADCLWRKAPGSWAGPQPDDLGYIPLQPTTHFPRRVVHFTEHEPGYAELWRRWSQSFRRPDEEDLAPHLPKSHRAIRMVSVECCGQFIASKQAIRRNPRQLYEIALDVAYMFDGTAPAFAATEDKRSSKAINWAGVAFEHLWHVLLGQRKDMLPTCNPCGKSMYRTQHGEEWGYGPFRCCATTTCKGGCGGGTFCAPPEVPMGRAHGAEA